MRARVSSRHSTNYTPLLNSDVDYLDRRNDDAGVYAGGMPRDTLTPAPTRRRLRTAAGCLEMGVGLSPWGNSAF